MKKTLFAAAIAAVALAVTSCGGEQGNVTVGKSSKLDSLSYALGANIAYSVERQMSDIPFNYTAIANGLTDAAFEKSKISQDDAVETLRDYFMNKRQERSMAVEATRNAADSVAIAGGANAEEVAAAREALKADASMFDSEAEREELSYAFGIDLGTNIKEADIPIQTYWVNSAMNDVATGSPVMTADDAVAFLNNYFNVVRPAELAEEVAVEMAKIAKQKGVVTTESGLMYRIEKEGEELRAINDADVVKVFYTGKLIRTGDVFDTNRFADRTEEQKEAILAQNPDAATADEPIEFPLNRVIPGWTEGMKLVGKGGRISLWIPSELAYGSQGAGRAIGPNEGLYFDVEILDVTPATVEEAAE